MPKFRATVEDLAKAKVVTPGWQPVEMYRAVMEKDKDGAWLWQVFGRVIGGKADDQGAILRAQFSEKAQGMIKNFYEALTGQTFEPEKDYEMTEKTVAGQRMEWYVERGRWRGRDTNDVVDFRPIQSEA